MDIKRLIPGVLAILTIIVFFTGVYTSASGDMLIKEDCKKCHQGYVPKTGAKDVHANADLTAEDCKVCHESAEQAHLSEDFVLSDCVHCHESDRGGAMAYSECSDCHVKDPHEDVPSEECETCHTSCNSCHAVDGISVEGGNHVTLQCNGCHVYHLYLPDCTNCHGHHHNERENASEYTTQTCISCHGPVHPTSYSGVKEGVVRT
ncbi:MAG: hypothetical protein M8350_06420 [Methanosarcinaceae archaeon]|nr:hypothetical protein [Methanosarcinaceae archaeon]